MTGLFLHHALLMLSGVGVFLLTQIPFLNLKCLGMSWYNRLNAS